MKNRKNYIVDKKFQYGRSIRAIGAVTILLAVLILAVGLKISINNKQTAENNKVLIDNSDNIKKILELQQSIYMKFSTIPYGVDKKTFSSISIDLTKDYNSSTRNLHETSVSNDEIIKSNNEIMKTNNYLIILMIVITVSGLAILFIKLIKYTHRISGPIYLMTLYGNEILKGGKPEIRKLRDKDEFEDFYSLFTEMCERIIEKDTDVKK